MVKRHDTETETDETRQPASNVVDSNMPNRKASCAVPLLERSAVIQGPRVGEDSQVTPTHAGRHARVMFPVSVLVSSVTAAFHVPRFASGQLMF